MKSLGINTERHNKANTETKWYCKVSKMGIQIVVDHYSGNKGLNGWQIGQLLIYLVCESGFCSKLKFFS